MNDTVKQIMMMVDEYMIQERDGANGCEARQALQEELTRLFTPLTDEQINALQLEHVGKTKWFTSIVRDIEVAHGITGEKND